MIKRKRGLNRRGEAMACEVLRVTLERLAEVGFERLSVADVAAEAGVNKTSVYRRWATKGALVREALESALGEPRDVVETGDLRTDLLAWGRSSLRFATSPVGQAVFRALLVADSDEIIPLARELRETVGGPRAVLERARSRGELRADADVELALSTVAGALLQRLVIERGVADEALLAGVVDLVLDGLRP
jgi:AcrR family transcriptional regulator